MISIRPFSNNFYHFVMARYADAVTVYFPQLVMNFSRVYPVSYTHLDVYKRQHYICQIFISMRLNKIDWIFNNSVFICLCGVCVCVCVCEWNFIIKTACKVFGHVPVTEWKKWTAASARKRKSFLWFTETLVNLIQYKHRVKSTCKCYSWLVAGIP